MTPEKLDELERLDDVLLRWVNLTLTVEGAKEIRDAAARREAALREALMDYQRFHDAWVTRGMTCSGTHAIGEALCQNVTAVNAALLSEVPQ